MPYAIDVRQVEKVYRGKVHALRGVTMRVRRGEVYGLLGPNGAGKSTLVKILTTLVRPTSCEGTLLGDPIGQPSTLARVGYLPENPKFPSHLTGGQALDWAGAMTGVARRERRQRTGELLDLVRMRKWERVKIARYSKGMRQRIGLAQALINNPEVVLLDEPTDGVDPVGRKEIRDVLVEMKERGTTVLLNSHLLSEAEMVCDRVSILVQGRMAMEGTLDELTVGQRRYEIECGVEGVDAGSLSCAAGLSVEGRVIRVDSDDAETVQPVIDGLRARGVVIRSVRAFRPSLEDLFIAAVSDPTTGATADPGASGDARRGRRNGAGS